MDSQLPNELIFFRHKTRSKRKKIRLFKRIFLCWSTLLCPSMYELTLLSVKVPNIRQKRILLNTTLLTLVKTPQSGPWLRTFSPHSELKQYHIFSLIPQEIHGKGLSEFGISLPLPRDCQCLHTREGCYYKCQTLTDNACDCPLKLGAGQT